MTATTGLGALDAAAIAIAACANERLAAQASGLLAELERLLGVQRVTELLDGARAGAGKYECEYHPVLLSWVQDYALESLLSMMVTGQIVENGELRELLAKELDMHVRTLAKYEVFRMISHY